jgi:hypothetical protein
MSRSFLRGLLPALLLFLTVAPSSAEESRSSRSSRSESGRSGTYVTNRSANLYSSPSATARIVAKLKPNTIIDVVDTTDQWYEVRSSKGKKSGFIRRSYADPYTRSRGTMRRFRSATYRLTSAAVVHAEPDVDSRKVTTLRAGTEVTVVGRTGSWYRIASDDERKPPGYIPTMAADRVGSADGSGRSSRTLPASGDDSSYDRGRSRSDDLGRDRDDQRDLDQSRGRDLNDRDSDLDRDPADDADPSRDW